MQHALSGQNRAKWDIHIFNNKTLNWFFYVKIYFIWATLANADFGPFQLYQNSQTSKPQPRF